MMRAASGGALFGAAKHHGSADAGGPERHQVLRYRELGLVVA
jgi:hypothetical protein